MKTDRLFINADKGPIKSGVPLGGLGTGKIELLPSGRLNRLTIQNNWSAPLVNNPKVNPAHDLGLLGFHFALRVKRGMKSQVRLLQHGPGTGLSRPAHWPGFARVGYKGAFPKVLLTFDDPGLGVNVRLKAFSPVIPHDYEASSVPACVFSFEAENRSPSPCEVSLLAVGRNISGSYGVGRRNRVEDLPGSVQVHFENAVDVDHEAQAGSLTLALVKRARHLASALGEWNLYGEHFRMDRVIDLEPLAVWRETGRLPNTSRKEIVRGGSVTWGGAVADSFHLQAKGASRASFVLTWHYPNAPEGHAYARRFSDSGAACLWTVKNRDRLEAGVERWHKIIDDAALPAWLAQALPNSLSPLVSSSRWAKDGRFWLYEAPEICPYLGTLDVRFYGALPLALLYPDLDKRELKDFARAQRPDGYVPHDLGWMRPDCPGDGTTPFLWKDLAPKFVLQVYREGLWTHDKEFLKALYPAVKKALLWERKWDSDGDGLPDHEGADQTFDLWNFKGASAYVSGIYLAALLAAQRMAASLGDSSSEALYAETFRQAQTSFLEKLWNGRYFIAWKSTRGASTACTAGQLAGQWYADLLNLGNIVPAPYIQSSLAAMLRLNARASRYGAVNSVFSSGEIDRANRHAKNIFVGVSYALSGLAIRHGFAKEGLSLAEKTWRNILEEQRSPWNQPDMISSSTGKFLFGDSYMRNMVLWAVPFALAHHNPSVKRMIQKLGAPGGVKPF